MPSSKLPVAKKANILANCVVVGGLLTMVAAYVFAFSVPEKGILLLVDNYREGIPELAMFTGALLVSLWNLSSEVKLCATRRY